MERTLEEVGQAVARRRNELGLDAAELARRADVDPKTLASLEKGERWPRDKSRARIEAALRWDIGSINRIRSGGSPTVSGVIRGRDGHPIETFTAFEGGEQETLERLRLASIIMDARDLARSNPGPLMTALAAILEEATGLALKLIARGDGDDDIIQAAWFVDQARASNKIRRVGSVYVLDEEERSEADIAVRKPTHRAAPPGGDDAGSRDDSEPRLDIAHPAGSIPATDDRGSTSLPVAARATPSGHRKGSGEQGEADGEDNQDQGH